MQSKLSDVYLQNCLHLVLSSEADDPEGLVEHASPTGTSREIGDDSPLAEAAGFKAFEAAVAGFDIRPFIDRARSLNVVPPDTLLPSWDGIGAGMDEPSLSKMIDQLRSQCNIVINESNSLHNSLEEKKKTYFRIMGNLGELNEYLRLVQLTVDALEAHIASRDARGMHGCCNHG